MKRSALVFVFLFALTASSSAAAIQHSGYDLILDAPVFVRTGDWETIRLDVVPIDAGAQAGAGCCTMIVESRLELIGAEFNPSGLISEPIAKDGRAVFYWRIRAGGDDSISGEIKTYLRLIPINGGAESRTLLSAQEIAVRPLGLDGSTSRLLGWFGLGVSFILWLPIVSNKLIRSKFHK